jgi:hypothetical protein
VDNICPSCRYSFTDAELEGEPRCGHPVHHGHVDIYPACSTARHPSWWGKDACGQEGKFWEPTE